jgi:hypothetical protein
LIQPNKDCSIENFSQKSMMSFSTVSELYDWHPAEEERIFWLLGVLCEGRRKLIREAV